MGITTFSGPVRSDNGFQEWNGSEWVTVTGGGGGGGATMINVTNPSAIATYPFNTILLDSPTEIGQTYTISVGWGEVPGGGTTLNVGLSALPAGADNISFTGRIVNGSISGSDEIAEEGTFSYSLTGGAACALITVVYTGLGTVGGEAVYARFNVSGMIFDYAGG